MPIYEYLLMASDAVLILGAVTMYWFSPRMRRNWVFGYGSPRSMINDAAWQSGNRFAGTALALLTLVACQPREPLTAAKADQILKGYQFHREPVYASVPQRVWWDAQHPKDQFDELSVRTAEKSGFINDVIKISDQLLSLNLANFFMIGADGKNRNMAPLPDLLDIVCVMVQHDPANIRGGGRARYLRKRGSAGGLEHDGIRTR